MILRRCRVAPPRTERWDVCVPEVRRCANGMTAEGPEVKVIRLCLDSGWGSCRIKTLSLEKRRRKRKERGSSNRSDRM